MGVPYKRSHGLEMSDSKWDCGIWGVTPAISSAFPGDGQCLMRLWNLRRNAATSSAFPGDGKHTMGLWNLRRNRKEGEHSVSASVSCPECGHIYHKRCHWGHHCIMFSIHSISARIYLLLTPKWSRTKDGGYNSRWHHSTQSSQTW